MKCFMYSDPSFINGSYPSIGCGLIPYPFPDTFLWITTGLIWRQIFTMKSMLSTKHLNGFTFMPSCSVYVEPDPESSELLTNISQTFQKAFTISGFSPNYTCFSYQRSNPAEYIYPFIMHAGSKNFKTLSFFGPTHAQSGVGSESGFIFKYYCFTGSQRQKFFLNVSKISSLHLSLLEHTNTLPVSTEIQDYASSFVPDALSMKPENVFSNIQQESDRPIGRGLCLLPSEIFPDLSPVSCVSAQLKEPVAQDEASIPEPLIRLCLRHESIDLGFLVIHQEFLISIPASDPPPSATWPLSLFPSGHREYFWHRLSDFPALLLCGLTTLLGFSCL